MSMGLHTRQIYGGELQKGQDSGNLESVVSNFWNFASDAGQTIDVSRQIYHVQAKGHCQESPQPESQLEMQRSDLV